jgi:GT2 family glycosyltransferase
MLLTRDAGSDMRPGADCVVVNYRTPKDLFEFGQSYLDQDYPSTLVVVNVCPEPADIEVARDLVEMSGGEYAEFDENCGYATAVNHGSTLSDREIVVALNADVQLRGTAPEDDWGILGPMQTDQRGLLTHSGIFGTPENPTFEGNWHKKPVEAHRVIREAVSVSGSAYFVKRDLWRELTECSLFRRACPEAEGAMLVTPHYYEEMFVSLHARSHGYKVIYDGTTEIIHKWHQASPIGGWADRQMPISRDIFRRACDIHNFAHE